MPSLKNSEKRTSRRAGSKEKMIELRIGFWTNEISDVSGQIIPKHAWDSGVVRMGRNRSHGIAPRNPTPFNSLMHLTQVIEKVLTAHGVTLHLDRRSRRYLRE